MSDQIETTVPTEAPQIDPSAPTEPPATTEPAEGAEAAEAPTNGDGDASSLSFSKDAFEQRLGQAKRSAVKGFLQEMGFEKPEDLQEWRQAADAAIQAERERARAKMTEVDRFKQDLEAEKVARAVDQQARLDAEKQAEALRVQNHLHGLFVSKGIRNTEYALFRVEQALAKLDDDQELDEVSFIDELCASDMEKAALGLAAQQTQPDQRAANTAPGRNGPDPRPQAGDDDFDAMSATPEELEKRLRQLGFHG